MTASIHERTDTPTWPRTTHLLGIARNVAINEWWAADSARRYWMEIKDRSDLGADPFAPTTDGSGRPYCGLGAHHLTYVQPGDMVLHWHKTLVEEPIPYRYTLPQGGKPHS